MSADDPADGDDPEAETEAEAADTGESVQADETEAADHGAEHGEADHGEAEHDEDHHGDAAHAPESESTFATDRTTAPQSPYTGRDVAVGALVAAVGIAFTVVVPFLLA